MNLPNRRQLEITYEHLRPDYERILQELTEQIRPWFEADGLHVGIKVRVKSFSSWFDKVLKKIRHGVSPDQVQIHDVLGIRLVCPFLDDLRHVEALVRHRFQVIEEERKGALQSFKEFGYDSTHFLITLPPEIAQRAERFENLPCEIQVRTILQDAWAEVEHELVYKSKFAPFDQPLKRKMAALNANLTLSDIIFQEIREYQRQLNRELEKRRDLFFACDQAPKAQDDDAEDRPTRVPNMDQLLLDALTAHNRHHYKQAINLYSSILKLGPQAFVQSTVLAHRGMAYFAESLHEDALEDFDRAIELDAKNAKAFFYRATVRDGLGEPAKALADFNRSLELIPFQPDVLLGRAHCWLRAGQPENALADGLAARDLAPEDPLAEEFVSRLQVEKKSTQ